MFVNILTSSLAGKTNTICRNSRLLKTVEEEMKILKKKKTHWGCGSRWPWPWTRKEKKWEGGHVEVNGVPLRSEREQTPWECLGNQCLASIRPLWASWLNGISGEPIPWEREPRGELLAQSTDLLERRETLISLWDLLFAWVGFLASPMDSHEILQTTEFSVCSLRLRLRGQAACTWSCSVLLIPMWPV